MTLALIFAISIHPNTLAVIALRRMAEREWA